jgi:hypothetical protein
MPERRRVDIRGILADPDLRRELMVPTLQATQAREGIETSRELAERAYYVVTESERAVFFDLERFRGGKGKSDRRHEIFVRALRGDVSDVRFDIARRDFGSIEGSPLSYGRIGLIAHLFRENAPIEPSYALVRRGASTGDDPRYVRYWWEPGIYAGRLDRFAWVRFAKGGDFGRFYADIDLVVHWDPVRRTFVEFHGRKGRETERPESSDDFFKPGLTWPRRTQRGFNLRVLPAGCAFADKGPAVFPGRSGDTWFLLGVGNSAVAEYVLQALTSFGSWEVGVVKRLPIPRPRAEQHELIGELAEAIHDAKAAWDEGNETSTRFRIPWLLREDLGAGISLRLEHLAEYEGAEEARIRKLYAELNDEVYKLYGISQSTRGIIEETLGNRPAEVLWPQMEGRSTEQKRMEHVWRVLSYAVKRVVEANEDGIVSFGSVGGEPGLMERVGHELSELFPNLDPNQVEIEITNELKRTVKGYRRSASIGEWFDKAFFEYHCVLYKGRPGFWHVASAPGTSPSAFGAVVHYHRFDRNRMAKLRGRYIRDAIEEFRREAGLADRAGRADDRLEWQARVEEAQSLDRRLQWIQEGHHEGPDGGDKDYRILTPWKEPNERPKGWNPDLDDGVKVNIEPLEKAGVLRVPKVT